MQQSTPTTASLPATQNPLLASASPSPSTTPLSGDTSLNIPRNDSPTSAQATTDIASRKAAVITRFADSTIGAPDRGQAGLIKYAATLRMAYRVCSEEALQGLVDDLKTNKIATQSISASLPPIVNAHWPMKLSQCCRGSQKPLSEFVSLLLNRDEAALTTFEGTAKTDDERIREFVDALPLTFAARGARKKYIGFLKNIQQMTEEQRCLLADQMVQLKKCTTYEYEAMISNSAIANDFFDKFHNACHRGDLQHAFMASLMQEIMGDKFKTP